MNLITTINAISLRICAGSVNKLVINQLYHSVAEVLLYKNR